MAVFGHFAPDAVRVLSSYTHGSTHYEFTQIKDVMLAPNNFAVVAMKDVSADIPQGQSRYFDVEAYFTKYSATIEGEDYILVALADAAATHLVVKASTLPTSEAWSPHMIKRFKLLETKSRVSVTPSMKHFKTPSNVLAIVRYYLNM